MDGWIPGGSFFFFAETDKLKKIAEMKKNDLTAGSLEAAMSIIAGTARSMGVIVEGWNEKK